MDRICHCGVQASYEHHPKCPFPLYHEDRLTVGLWNFAFKLAKGEGLGLADVFPFGDHRHETIEDVIRDRPSYIEWALDEIKGFVLDDAAQTALDDILERSDPLEDLF